MRRAHRIPQGRWGARYSGRGVGGPPPDAPQQVFVCNVGGLGPSIEEGADLQRFTPAREHLLLREVYGDFPPHNKRTHLKEGVPDDTIWQSRWEKLAAQSASWYSTPHGKVGQRFTAVLAEEWRGLLYCKWNSEQPLVFAHVVLTRTLSACNSRVIQERIDRQLDLWERGIHTGLVGGVFA